MRRFVSFTRSAWFPFIYFFAHWQRGEGMKWGEDGKNTEKTWSSLPSSMRAYPEVNSTEFNGISLPSKHAMGRCSPTSLCLSKPYYIQLGFFPGQLKRNRIYLLKCCINTQSPSQIQHPPPGTKSLSSVPKRPGGFIRCRLHQPNKQKTPPPWPSWLLVLNTEDLQK